MAKKPSDQWMKSGKSPGKTTKKPANTRLAYSLDEDENILRYILINDRRSQIKGNAIWQTMARKKVAGNRTWQSLKNRFLKSILPNLHKYDITPADRAKLTSG